MNGRFTIRHVWEVRIGRKILNYCGSTCLVQVESGNFLLIDLGVNWAKGQKIA